MPGDPFKNMQNLYFDVGVPFNLTCSRWTEPGRSFKLMLTKIIM